jgi:hypothetical protein
MPVFQAYTRENDGWAPDKIHAYYEGEKEDIEEWLKMESKHWSLKEIVIEKIDVPTLNLVRQLNFEKANLEKELALVKEKINKAIKSK